jgi:hypothetical protein
MTYSLEELRELIPLYLNQRLSEKERRTFEDGLHQYPELKSELKEFSEIKEIYKEIEEDVSLPSDAIFQRVLKNIQPQIKISLIPPKKSFLEQIQDVLKWVFHSPRLSWGVVAVQLAIILLLLITLPKEDLFRTLTSRTPKPAEGVKINVIFDKEAKEKEIMDLLIKAGAIIIRGPSPEGLYIVEVERKQDIKKVIENLKEARIVKFAEMAY